MFQQQQHEQHQCDHLTVRPPSRNPVPPLQHMGHQRGTALEMQTSNIEHGAACTNLPPNRAYAYLPPNIGYTYLPPNRAYTYLPTNKGYTYLPVPIFQHGLCSIYADATMPCGMLLHMRQPPRKTSSKRHAQQQCS